MSVAALVLAAGRGERFGGNRPKAFVLLDGEPLLVHSLRALAASSEVDRVVPVVPPEQLEAVSERLAGLRLGDKLAAAVAGGRERQDSMRAGLEAVAPGAEWVAVHDAARPLVRPEAVSRVVRAARETGAAILAGPVRDTLKQVRGEQVVSSSDRSQFRLAQTPQVFRTELLREGLAKAEAEGIRVTDDAQLVERLGVAVRVVEGDPDNLKITVPEDLVLAEACLAHRRNGSRA